MRTSFSRLPAAILAVAALAGPALGQAQPILAHELVDDVLLPSPADLKARAAAVRVLPGPASAGGERVSYRAFNGRTYELTRFHGRHVDVFLPDTWTEPGALSEELIRAYVDRNDLIYQHLLDLTGAPPAGEGPLPVAIVPETCGLGCGNLGAKGVEMKDVPEYRSLFWQEIAANIPSGVIVHEMTYNFDLFSRYVAYPPDNAHAWTDFISYYYSVYAREGALNMTPDETAKYWLSTTARYFQDPGADWVTVTASAGSWETAMTAGPRSVRERRNGSGASTTTATAASMRPSGASPRAETSRLSRGSRCPRRSPAPRRAPIWIPSCST